MTTRTVVWGECEEAAMRLLRGADLSASAEIAIRGIARYADELAKRLDHLEAEVPHVQPPVPLQQLERFPWINNQ